MSSEIRWWEICPSVFEDPNYIPPEDEDLPAGMDLDRFISQPGDFYIVTAGVEGWEQARAPAEAACSPTCRVTIWMNGSDR